MIGIRKLVSLLAVLVAAAVAPAGAQGVPPLLELPELCTFSSTGANPYFILEPGWKLDLAGIEEGKLLTVSITVTDETKVVNGVETRVVFEEEKADGELVEQSWNWFAICEESGSVFYFGEHVDIYEGGVVTSHEGSWEAGVDNARPGVMMPGQPAAGMVHLQEIAPIVALDTAVVLGVDDQIEVPAGAFDGAQHVLETTPLEPGQLSEKWYVPGIGLAIDGVAELVSYGFVS